MELRIKTVHDEAIIPVYAHETDSGMDLFSVEEKIIGPGQSDLVKTGLTIELPKGTEAQIRPRSGLALKHQVSLLNTPGTIDEGYRGEIAVIVINHGKGNFKVSKGMKIAQMVISPVIRVRISMADELSQSKRGTNGFGSTGA